MRNLTIQYIRIVAMLIIIAYHCVCYYGVWKGEFQSSYIYDNIHIWRNVCVFAMNAFVFIAGVLYAAGLEKGKYCNTGVFLKKKFIRLLCPYIIWSIIVIGIFQKDAFTNILYGIQHLWFLLMIFGVYFLVSMMKAIINKNTILIWFFTFVIFNAIANKYLQIDNLLQWQLVVKYIPAFLAGMVTIYFKIPKYLQNINIYLRSSILVILSIFLVLTFILQYFPYGQFYIYLPTYAWLICTYSVLSQFKLKSNKQIDNLDKNSMGMYIIHHILIWAIILYIPVAKEFLDIHYYLGPVILFMLILGTSWAAANFIKNSNLLGILFGNTIYKKEKTNLTSLQ